MLLLDTDKYVAVYMALSCVEETAPTVEKFRSFVVDAVNRRDEPAVHSYAKQIVAELTSFEKGDSLTHKYGECAAPYQDPATATDARLALDAVKPLMSRINPLFRQSNIDAYESTVGKAVTGWSSRDASNDEAFLVWWCGNHDAASC